MIVNSPQSKRQTPTVIDLEIVGRSAHDDATSSCVPESQTSESTTPDTRRSQDIEENVSREQHHATSRRKWISDRVPQPLAHRASKTVKWINGPQPPRLNRINPYFERAQTFPVRVLSRLPRPVRNILLATAFLLWIILFGVTLSRFGLPQDFGGFGPPVQLSCITRLWPDSSSCGLNGMNCLPFDDASFAFSCPANCAGVQVLNPRTIGDQQIIYRPLVVGGAPNASEANQVAYRGDSFICGAAIHAGVLRNTQGGCGVLSLTGEKSSYGAFQSNGIQSVSFNSSFPLSFDFNRDQWIISSAGKCQDPRWNLLILSTVFTVFFSLFAANPAIFFGSVFIIIYFQVAMASDPPPYSSLADLASTAVGNFLPAAFVGVMIYRFAVYKTLKHLTSHIEKTILWVGASWVGALSNVTLELIPIQRLTPHDLHQQPGAIVALVFIVLIIAGVAIYQAWCFRNERRLPRYLALYAALGIGLLILLAIPKLNLRIHHYILALLLLPGTSTQTRPSLLFQGLLVGLFINGVARWGFASVLQTEVALRGDALQGSDIPIVFTPIINATNITFSWEGLARGYDGVSVLVNDVERFRGSHKNGDSAFTWARHDLEHPEFFRFGFVNYLLFGAISYSDFTMSGTWWPNGTWSDIPPGRS